MKKRNIFLSFIFAILAALSLGANISPTNHSYAAGIVTITLDASGGECAVSELQTTESGTLSALPEATKAGYVFAGWMFNEQKVTTKTVFSEDSTITALFHLKTHYYTISQSESSYTVVGGILNSEETYVISQDEASLQTAITEIENDLLTADNQTTLDFNDVTLAENLNLSFQQLTLSGNLNLDEFSLQYNIPTNNSKLNFNDLTLNATSNQNLIEIYGSNRLLITCSNTEFNSSSNAGNYALHMNNSASISLTFEDKLSHQTQFLYNHDTGVSTSANGVDLSNHSGKIRISIPYYEDGSVIVTSNIGASKFEFIPLQDNYTADLFQNGNDIHADLKFKIKFDPNGGTLDNSLLEQTSNFKPYASVKYPDSNDITKTHATLNGYAGKITLTPELMSLISTDVSVWYFDKVSLNSFIENSVGLEDIPTYFSETLPSANNNGFTYYSYDNNLEDPNVVAVILMIKLNLDPEFVALWSETIYKISFNTNGGSNIDDILGIYDSSFTLPTPTKTGYTFAGWYSSEDLDEASLVNASNFNKMPDTNPTLYAKWTATGHTISIYPNNNTSELTRIIPYDTSLSSIIELTSDYFSKTGHSFVGWYTDVSLDESSKIEDLESFTMPNSNLNVYAKWQINSYTITLNTNHSKDDSDFTSLTVNYGDDITSLKLNAPSFEGYEFKGWVTSSKTHYANTYPYLPDTMPDEDITLYADWDAIEYVIRYYLANYPTDGNNYLYSNYERHFEDTVSSIDTPNVSGFIFNGWYADSSFTQTFALTSMPSHDISVYAKMTPKQTIQINTDVQSYTISQNLGFKIKINLHLSGFKVEYLVNDKWQSTTPTEKGTYNVRITRAEDAAFNAVNVLIENGLKITPNVVDLGTYSLILYCVAALEIFCSIVILLLRKQRQTYLKYSIALPFGLVSTSDFINFSISLVLAVFGFVMIIIQLTALRKVNHEVDKVSTENKDYVPPDVSTNDSIASNVEILLQKQGFISPRKDEEVILDGSISDEQNESPSTSNTINDEHESDQDNSDSDSLDIDLDIDLD